MVEWFNMAKTDRHRDGLERREERGEEEDDQREEFDREGDAVCRGYPINEKKADEGQIQEQQSTEEQQSNSRSSG